MTEQSFLDGRVIVKFGTGTDGILITDWASQLFIVANAFDQNVLSKLPFRTHQSDAATAQFDKRLTINKAYSVSRGNPNTPIPRRGGGTRATPVTLGYDWGYSSSEFQTAQIYAFNRPIVQDAYDVVNEGCMRYITEQFVDVLDMWLTADNAKTSGANQVISSTTSFKEIGGGDTRPASWTPTKRATGQPMNYSKLIAADDLLSYNNARGFASPMRIVSGNFRQLSTQLRGDMAIQHEDFRANTEMRKMLEVAERTAISGDNYIGMFGNKYLFCAIPVLGDRGHPFKNDRTEKAGTGTNAGFPAANVTNVEAVYMMTDDAILNYRFGPYPELEMEMMPDPGYKRRMLVDGLTNLTPNIYHKENIVPILCTAVDNGGVAQTQALTT